MNTKVKFRTQQACFTPDPYIPKFQDDWKLNGGGGDLWIYINNQNNSSSHQYWITLHSYDASKILRGDGSEVCFVKHIHLETVFHDFKISLTPALKP
jgi:hypothetical protein